ncbi:MAG TPA: DUF5946 family protein [Anaerolineales bacterium]|nr:DUF5946 family protein [Anaerolineales bacterium]
MTCPECGAPDHLCQTRFDEFLVLEFTDPGYGAVHHLTVAAYMLQHSSKMTREGWLHERELLKEFLVEKKSPAFIRKQNKVLVDSGKRKFKFKSKDGVPVIQKSIWKKTILNVRAENAEVYCEDINAWARSALEEASEINLETTNNETK